MKVNVIIPTYWGRSTPEIWKEGDTVFAHPIPLNSQAEALKKTILSFNSMNNLNFNMIILAAGTTPEIEKEMENKLRKILKEIKVKFSLFLVSHSHVKNILGSCNELSSKCQQFISLNSYSNIKNVGLMISHMHDAEVAVFVDDDEYVTDSEFIDKTLEFVGREYRGVPVYGVSGYYVYQNGSYKLKESIVPWMTYWNKVKWMNKTFERLIDGEPRLKGTPFLFGGCMVLHRQLYQKIPFDPYLNRGEEFDYLLTAQMFGYTFFLDNKLFVNHEPPPVSYPDWMQLREDIHTFVYLQTKLRTQQDSINMRRRYAEDFDPYPGYFLQKNLLEFLYKANMMLANSYLIEGDNNSAAECLRNIQIAHSEAMPQFNPFLKMVENQPVWEKLMATAVGKRQELAAFIEKIQ